MIGYAVEEGKRKRFRDKKEGNYTGLLCKGREEKTVAFEEWGENWGKVVGKEGR